MMVISQVSTWIYIIIFIIIIIIIIIIIKFIIIIGAVFQLILLSGVSCVDQLRGHQDHLLIFVVIINLIIIHCMLSVGSGSLLCRVIIPRPVSYLEHCWWTEEFHN